jgi:hypothetical protein
MDTYCAVEHEAAWQQGIDPTRGAHGGRLLYTQGLNMNLVHNERLLRSAAVKGSGPIIRNELYRCK